jgi:hypothetical protein
MQIKVHGEMSMLDIRQAVFEKLHEAEAIYGVRYSRGATLFLNPTNGFGDRVTPRDHAGGEVTKLHSTGPYRSAADRYVPVRASGGRR